MRRDGAAGRCFFEGPPDLFLPGAANLAATTANFRRSSGQPRNPARPMRIPRRLFSIVICLTLPMLAARGQTAAATPDENPEGNTGALKAQVTTARSYDAHSGNATRIVTDLHVPGAPGVYGLEFTRYWNSTPNDHDNPFAEAPSHFGPTGWSHSWDWHAYEEDTSEKIGPMDDNTGEIWTTAITITFPDGHANRYKITRSNRWHETAPPDPRSGPPYTVPDQNGFLASGFVHDLVQAI